jgi:hypothetical protein
MVPAGPVIGASWRTTQLIPPATPSTDAHTPMTLNQLCRPLCAALARLTGYSVKSFGMLLRHEPDYAGMIQWLEALCGKDPVPLYERELEAMREEAGKAPDRRERKKELEALCREDREALREAVVFGWQTIPPVRSELVTVAKKPIRIGPRLAPRASAHGAALHIASDVLGTVGRNASPSNDAAMVRLVIARNMLRKVWPGTDPTSVAAAAGATTRTRHRR